MLTRERVEEIVFCRISEDEIRQELSRLSFDNVTIEEMRLFIEVLKAAANGALGPAAGSLPAGSTAAKNLVLDCSGTGGSGRPRFNTSTAVAFVAAAAGVKVAKFGNRSASGGSGSFDLLEALGLARQLDPAAVSAVLEDVGLVFMFAPHYYPFLAKLADVRKSLPCPTVFNAVGPLLHPLSPSCRVMGTSNENVQRLAARLLAEDPNTRRAMVVRAENGLDEIDPAVDSTIFVIEAESVSKLELGARSCRLPDYLSGSKLDARASMEIFSALLAGRADEYLTSLVAVNAGACLQVWGAVESIEAGEAIARECIQSGKMKEKVEQLRRSYAAIAG